MTQRKIIQSLTKLLDLLCPNVIDEMNQIQEKLLFPGSLWSVWPEGYNFMGTSADVLTYWHHTLTFVSVLHQCSCWHKPWSTGSDSMKICVHLFHLWSSRLTHPNPHRSRTDQCRCAMALILNVFTKRRIQWDCSFCIQLAVNYNNWLLDTSPSVLCSHPGLFFHSLYVFCCPSLSWSFGHHMPQAGWWAFPECCNFFLKECLEFFVWCRGGANMGSKAFGHTHHGLDAAHAFNWPYVASVYYALNLNQTVLERRLPFLKCTVGRRSRSQNVNGAQTLEWPLPIQAATMNFVSCQTVCSSSCRC